VKDFRSKFNCFPHYEKHIKELGYVYRNKKRLLPLQKPGLPKQAAGELFWSAWVFGVEATIRSIYHMVTEFEDFNWKRDFSAVTTGTVISIIYVHGSICDMIKHPTIAEVALLLGVNVETLSNTIMFDNKERNRIEKIYEDMKKI